MKREKVDLFLIEGVERPDIVNIDKFFISIP